MSEATTNLSSPSQRNPHVRGNGCHLSRQDHIHTRQSTSRGVIVGPLGAVVLIVVLTAMYWREVSGLALDWWKDPNYSHGFLVPLVSIWLLWRAWSRQKHWSCNRLPGGWTARVWSLTPPRAWALLLVGIVIYVFGSAAAEDYSSRMSLVIILLGLLAICWEERVAKTAIPAVLYLIFMIPLPYVIYYSISFPLQLFSATMADGGLQLFGVPTVREGNIIRLPGTTLEVAVACSGLRSLMTLGALAALLGLLVLRTWPRRILLLALSIPAAVLGNLARLWITGMLIYTLGKDVAEGFAHQLAGLVSFLTALGLLGAGALALGWRPAKDGQVLRKTSSRSAPPAEEPRCASRGGWRLPIVPIALVLLLAATAVYAHMLRYLGPEAGQQMDLQSIPLDIDSWRGKRASAPSSALEILGSDAELLRTYSDLAGNEVHLFVGYHSRQGVQSQIHSPRHCYPGSGWVILDRGVVHMGGGDVKAAEMLVDREGERQEVIYWFMTRRGATHSEWGVKTALVGAALSRRPSDAALVRLSTSLGDSESRGDAQGRLVDCAESLAPQIARALGFGSDNR